MNHNYIVENFWQLLLELQKSQPRIGLAIYHAENSDFTSYTDNCRNCYMLWNAWENEDCLYGRSISFSSDNVDCEKVTKCTLCYECLDCANCYNCNHLQWCEDCTDCWLSYDLKGCQNCFGCIGLRHKQYHIFNQPYTPDQFWEVIKKLYENPQQIMVFFEKLKRKTPHLAAYNINTENCTGDLLRNCKNCQNCYILEDCEDCLYTMECVGAKDLVDTEFSEYAENNYECLSAWKLKNSAYCSYSWESSDLEYCEYVMRSLHCFGCIYLNHKEYHILNKAYEREEFFQLKEKIKTKMKADGTYGRLQLPPTHPYEDTLANDYWPLIN